MRGNGMTRWYAGNKARSMLLLWQTVMAIITITLPHMAAADDRCYRLLKANPAEGIEGGNHPICHELERNLNRFCAAPPMVCQFQIHPDFKRHFQLPRWTAMHAEQHLELIEELIKTPFLMQGYLPGVDAVWQVIEPQVSRGRQDKTLKLEHTVIDLANLGKKELVYRLSTGNCSNRNRAPKNGDFSRMYVQEGIIVNYAPEVQRKLHKKQYFINANEATRDVFFYKGHTYAYSWGMDQMWIIYPYLSKNGFAEKRVCTFEYPRDYQGE
jgi:hypothetical protein